jgi:hypothetical protein
MKDVRNRVRRLLSLVVRDDAYPEVLDYVTDELMIMMGRSVPAVRDPGDGDEDDWSERKERFIAP